MESCLDSATDPGMWERRRGTAAPSLGWARGEEESGSEHIWRPVEPPGLPSLGLAGRVGCALCSGLASGGAAPSVQLPWEVQEQGSYMIRSRAAAAGGIGKGPGGVAGSWVRLWGGVWRRGCLSCRADWASANGAQQVCLSIPPVRL